MFKFKAPRFPPLHGLQTRAQTQIVLKYLPGELKIPLGFRVQGLGYILISDDEVAVLSHATDEVL